jgi:hypothetical protein
MIVIEGWPAVPVTDLALNDAYDHWRKIGNRALKTDRSRGRLEPPAGVYPIGFF